MLHPETSINKYDSQMFPEYFRYINRDKFRRFVRLAGPASSAIFAMSNHGCQLDRVHKLLFRLGEWSPIRTVLHWTQWSGVLLSCINILHTCIFLTSSHSFCLTASRFNQRYTPLVFFFATAQLLSCVLHLCIWKNDSDSHPGFFHKYHFMIFNYC